MFTVYLITAPKVPGNQYETVIKSFETKEEATKYILANDPVDIAFKKELLYCRFEIEEENYDV